MNPFLMIFIGIFITLLIMSTVTIKKGPKVFLLNGIVVAAVGLFYGFYLVKYGTDFNDTLPELFGQMLIVFTSAISGGMVSSAYSELREMHRNTDGR